MDSLKGILERMERLSSKFQQEPISFEDSFEEEPLKCPVHNNVTLYEAILCGCLKLVRKLKEELKKPHHESHFRDLLALLHLLTTTVFKYSFLQFGIPLPFQAIPPVIAAPNPTAPIL